MSQVSVHQLRRARPLPMQLVRLLQVRQVRLHSGRPQLLCRRSHRVRGGPQADPAADQQPPGARRQNLLHPFTAHKANSRVYDNQTKRAKCL